MIEDNHLIEPYRLLKGYYGSDRSFGNNGKFGIPCNGKFFTVLISDGVEWDHVSISLPDATPSWDDMCYFKNLFFKPNETVIQYHPAESEYVNNHPYCLHLWRPHCESIPQPPSILVGIKT